MHDMAMDIGEAIVAPLVAIGQSLMVHSKEVETGGMKIVDMDLIFDHAEAELVGGAISESVFHAAAGHPDGEAFLVMIAAGGRLRAGARIVFLDHWRPAEFAAPDDEGVVEQTSLLEIGEQTGAGLVGAQGLSGQTGVDALVVIPAFVEYLDEADAAFDEAAGQEAVLGEIAAGSVAVESVEF